MDMNPPNPGVFPGPRIGLVVALSLIGIACRAQVPPPAPFGAIPSPQQLAWHEREFYAFVHFNMNTFTGVEWGEGTETPERFNPRELDCEQWCQLFKDCGLSGVVITAKHHDGFCLWPSKYTEHDVASSPWRAGRGDVIADLAAACKKYDLWLGIYISPWDRNNPIYGREDAAYNRYFIGQLNELLGNYGEVAEVWWDGANGDRGNPDKHQEYDWPAFVKTVQRWQPEAVIFAPPRAGATIRRIGNESGYAGETQWSTYDRQLGENTSLLHTGTEGAAEWIPAEVDVSIRPGWYWHPDTDNKVKSAEKLVEIYEQSVGRNTNLLLNFPVDQRGLVHENDSRALREMTEILHQTYTQDLARDQKVQASQTRGGAAQYAAALVTDGDDETYWAPDDGITSASLTVEFNNPTVFNRVTLQEHVELGQRIRAWNLEIWNDSGWSPIFSGTTVGHRRTAVFDAVTSARLRINITDSLATPTLETVAVFVTPPRVHIHPESVAFLDSTTVVTTSDLPGCTIHYTTDGQVPTTQSPRYDKPIAITESTTIRAAAARHGQISPRMSQVELVGYTRASLRPAVSFVRAPNGGIQVKRYEGGWQTLDQLSTREPLDTQTAKEINIDLRTRDEHVALVFEGFVLVPNDGLYEFFCTSDDGSRLSIGTTRVVENDGLHGSIERSGITGLQAGYHPIRVEWFNATGGRDLRVEWSGPQVPRQAIPASALFH